MRDPLLTDAMRRYPIWGGWLPIVRFGWLATDDDGRPASSDKGFWRRRAVAIAWNRRSVFFVYGRLENLHRLSPRGGRR